METRNIFINGDKKEEQQHKSKIMNTEYGFPFHKIKRNAKRVVAEYEIT